MKGISYRDRDYAFGETMLALRAKIGLTQAGLAHSLGVSRRAVTDWETGNSYPKAEHLKQLIALAMEQHAFRAGHEAEEVRLLWHTSHQKVLLDEAWLGEILLYTKSVDDPHVDWGDALATPIFYGREWELRLLTEWVVEQRCRVVSVLGLGGIGKSALAVNLMHQAAIKFDVVIWRSLRDLPNSELLLDSILQVVAPQVLSKVGSSLERRQSFLLEYMRRTRILLVLDNLEAVMEEGEGSGRFLHGYEGFGRFLRLSAETEHQSCVLLTSREKPIDLIAQEGHQSPVRALRLARLGADACEKLLTEKEVKGSGSERTQLIGTYTGNPLALKIVAQTIVDLFDGEIAPFLEQGEVIFGGVRELLSEQFARLSALEQSLMFWLAILRESSTFDELLAVLATPMPRVRLLDAVEALHRRSLIERGQNHGSFTLQSVVLEYVTAQLIADAGDEILNGKLARLIDHGLELAQAREYVRQTQERLILVPILALLQSAYPQPEAVEAQLITLLTQLTSLAEASQGYGPANLVTLLRLQRGNLRGLDLGGAILRGLYLQGVEMQDTRLVKAAIRDSVFTQTFDAIMAVAISSSGRYWAAASRRGEVQVWAVSGLTLHPLWTVYADTVWSLAFSPDERTLVTSGSLAVKSYDAASGALRWLGRHAGQVNSVAFAPDGRMVASSGSDAIVRIWDLQSGTQLQELLHPNVVSGVAWSPDGRLLASSDVEGSIRLWEIQETNPATCVHTLIGHTAWVDGLSFAPNGHFLASASWDRTVKLWDVASGQLCKTLTGHTDRVGRVAWSPDGSLVGSCSVDQTLWLWDVAAGSYRGALHGHTAVVVGLAFTPDSRSLLSGSEDGTLRVWDVANMQCVRIMQGHISSPVDVDWSPDGTQLVSGSTDTLVTIYDVTSKTSPRVLRGHGGVVLGVAWNSDGRLLASSEWDNTIRLWDSQSGECIQVFHHPDDTGNFFQRLAWSPDGQLLACGTFRRGVQMFEIMPQHGQWVGGQFPTAIRQIAWSPDSARLAGVGEDGIVYLWDVSNGKLFRRLTGHRGKIISVAWSFDGTKLASGGSSGSGGELFVWDPQSGEPVCTFVGYPRIIHAVAMGPSEDLLISGGGDGKLCWWDLQSGKCVQVREAHQGSIQSLRRSPDRTKLASCGDDGAIMLWDLNTGEYLRTLRRDRPYERLNIAGILGLTEAQKVTLRALGAIDEARNDEQPAEY